MNSTNCVALCRHNCLPVCFTEKLRFVNFRARVLTKFLSFFTSPPRLPVFLADRLSHIRCCCVICRPGCVSVSHLSVPGLQLTHWRPQIYCLFFFFVFSFLVQFGIVVFGHIYYVDAFPCYLSFSIFVVGKSITIVEAFCYEVHYFFTQRTCLSNSTY